MLKLDVWNIVFTIINLLVLYFIFKKFLFKPVLNVIKEREDKINGQFEEAKKANEDADNKKKEYEDKLIMAKNEADKIVLEARQRAEKEKNQTLESTRKEAQNIMDKAKADIVRDEETARKAAQADIARLAIAAAEKIIKTGDQSGKGSNE